MGFCFKHFYKGKKCWKCSDAGGPGCVRSQFKKIGLKKPWNNTSVGIVFRRGKGSRSLCFLDESAAQGLATIANSLVCNMFSFQLDLSSKLCYFFMGRKTCFFLSAFLLKVSKPIKRFGIRRSYQLREKSSSALFNSKLHSLFFLESLVLIRRSETLGTSAWMSDRVWLTSIMCVIKTGWEPANSVFCS